MATVSEAEAAKAAGKYVYKRLIVEPTLKSDGSWAGGAKTEWTGHEWRMSHARDIYISNIDGNKKSHAGGAVLRFHRRLMDVTIALESYIEWRDVQVAQQQPQQPQP